MGRAKTKSEEEAARLLAVERTGGRVTARITDASAEGQQVQVGAPVGAAGAAAAAGGPAARWLRHAFLPVGYPASVSPDYLSEPGWT